MKFFGLAMIVTFLAASFVVAETVHQSVPGDKLNSGDGGNAVEKGLVEVQKVEGGEEQVARIKPDMVKWGFVNCWFGQPAPEGKVIVRFRLYADSQKTAKYLVYVRAGKEQVNVGELKLPADAKEKTFVTVDVPVTAKEQWSGLVIKKADASSLPSPWIEKVSVVLPD